MLLQEVSMSHQLPIVRRYCVLGMHSRRRSYTVSEKLKKLEIGQRVENMMSAKVVFATGEK